MTALSPQFPTLNRDLNIKRGTSARVTFEITNTPSGNFDITIPGILNLQDSLIFPEIRRQTIGYKLIENFTATVLQGTKDIILESAIAYPSKYALLSSLPIYENDLITIEGSGIIEGRVSTVTAGKVTISDTYATQNVYQARIFNKSSVVSSFTPIVSSAVTVITTDEVKAGDTAIAVSSLSGAIASNKILTFGYRDIDRSWRFVGSARVASNVLANATSIPINNLILTDEFEGYIPVNAIAFSAASSINSAELILDSTDTLELSPGNYKYSVLVRSSSGFLTAILEGNINLTE